MIKSQVLLNAEKDPSYAPYCMRCPRLVRMVKVEPFFWRCKCGAMHDERPPIKLSDAQFVALLWMVKHGGGKTVRWPGGFWTIPEMPKQNLPRYAAYNYEVPLWHTGTQTVMAMERAGLLKRAGEEPNLQYWQAPRVVTDAGNRALDVAVAAGQCTQALKKWNLAADLKAFDSWGSRGTR